MLVYLEGQIRAEWRLSSRRIMRWWTLYMPGDSYVRFLRSLRSSKKPMLFSSRCYIRYCQKVLSSLRPQRYTLVQGHASRDRDFVSWSWRTVTTQSRVSQLSRMFKSILPAAKRNPGADAKDSAMTPFHAASGGEGKENSRPSSLPQITQRSPTKTTFPNAPHSYDGKKNHYPQALQPNKNPVEPLATDREFEKLLVRVHLHTCSYPIEPIRGS